MKKNYIKLLFCMGLTLLVSCQNEIKKESAFHKDHFDQEGYEEGEKSQEEKAIAAEERWMHDFIMQRDPVTGLIPRDEKQKEFNSALVQKQSADYQGRNTTSIISRGPSNLGGRTRALRIDLSDPSGNTILAGGVSSGLFRTTNGGDSWTKVSPFDEVHNVSALAQDPREGFQNIWYYATGEMRGNSASRGSFYYGNGIWKSTDGGVTWEQIPETNSEFGSYDSSFDLITDIEVHPVSGSLYVGTANNVMRISPDIRITTEFTLSSDNTRWTDLVITSTGRVYVAIDGRVAENGVYTSETGTGNWEKIASDDGIVAGFDAGRRITLALAPSNENIIYALYDNGGFFDESNPQSEADLWRYDRSTNTWTDFTAKMPDEPGGDSSGNDPFAHQGSYDLVISVKPDDENFVVIGGTNAYKIADITADDMFTRIGGYQNNAGYALYSNGGVVHHPDIHAFEWDPNDSSILYSGTDGGVHKTVNVDLGAVEWVNLNNDYLTYQYYHVTMLNKEGSDYIMGGAQDNGTTAGGLDAGLDNLTEMTDVFGGDGASVGLAEFTQGETTGIAQYLSTQNGRMIRFTPDAGSDITPVDVSDPDNPQPYPSKFVTYFYLDPENSNTVYYASESTVLRTNDALNVSSSTWTDLGTMPFGEQITTFEASKGAYDPASSFLLIGGESGRVFRMNDPLNVESVNSVVQVTPPGVISGLSGQFLSSLAIHPTNNDIVMATYSNYGSDIRNIFICYDITSNFPTWIEVERNLVSHSVRAAAIAEVDGETIFYAGTARGLYKSSDPENQDWTLVGGDIMGIPVISNMVYRNADKVLLIGTHGNGMYQANLNDSALSTEDNAFEISLAMYPNPVIYQLNFASNQVDLTDDTKYVIYDIKGSQVAVGKLKDKTIDVASLETGVYYVNLSQNNVTYSKKFVKN